MKKVEVLSPAGSYQSFRAAIHAGADAIYLGGTAFGARAYANNFSQEELIAAIDYAHIFGRKVYLTVNTLLRNDELENSLYDYLSPYYEAGLDAVIVQDFGVFNFIKKNFPKMHLHASTQMTITGRNSAELLKEMGASRIVTARELSLGEIADIHKNVDVEIESFVHGALCYCYSGQCLLSSFIGGRSGNRGRCAQPCRLPYQVIDENNSRQIKEEEKYILSPKDMCALDILPDVIDAGVYSLKIEGRMKNSEYTAGVVSMYRKYVDLYLENGRKGYKVSEEDRNNLKDLYNRGGFTDGYYKEHNERNMISLERPNHCGTRALKVLENKKGCLKCKVIEETFPGDVFEITSDFSITNKNHQQPGEFYVVNIPHKYRVVVGQEIFRTRNNALVESIRKNYMETEPKVLIDGTLKLTVGEAAILELKHASKECLDDLQEEIMVKCVGDVVEEANKQPMDEVRVRKQISKTGNTHYEFHDIKIVLKGNIFMPVQKLNDLRRNALEMLDKAVCDSYRRTLQNEQEKVQTYQNRDSIIASMDTTIKINCSAETMETVEELIKHSEVSNIYLEQEAFSNEELQDSVIICQHAGKKVFISLPYVHRNEKVDQLEKDIELLITMHADGFLVRNLEELQMLRQLTLSQILDNQCINIIIDYNLYTFNDRARQEFESLEIPGKFHIAYGTLPVELNCTQMSRLDNKHYELPGYGYLPMMVSTQCVNKTTGKCNHKEENIYMKDRKNKNYRVKNCCKYCYNLIYNDSPLYILDRIEEIESIDPIGVRLIFTTENRNQVRIIVESAIKGLIRKEEITEPPIEEYTKGHFFKGVE